MGVTTQTATEITNAESLPRVANNNIDVMGKLRFANITFTQSGAGDAGSSVALVDLPQGRVKVLANLSTIRVSALGSSRVMDIGFDAYTDWKGASVSADDDYFATDVDVSAAATVLFSEALNGASTKEFRSKSGVRLRATVAGGTIPDAATINGYVVYVIES